MSSDVVIRLATPADLPACAAIINDYIDATHWLPRVISRTEIEAILSPEILEGRTFFVAERDGEILGYMTMVEEGFIPALYLAPKARGMGIGQDLIAEAKRRSPEGLVLDCFEPNVAARRFYAREGFTEIEGARFTEEEGVEKLRLKWQP